MKKEAKTLQRENDELKKQLADLTAIVAMFAPTPLISQRKAKKIFGVPWLAEKERDADKHSIRLWVRTGSAVNSPKKYNLQQLNDILKWERENNLPYNFGNN